MWLPPATPLGTAPTPRSNGAAVVISLGTTVTSHRVGFFGGQSSSGPLDDVFYLDSVPCPTLDTVTGVVSFSWIMQHNSWKPNKSQ